MRLSIAQAKRLGLAIPKAKTGSVIQKPLAYQEVEEHCRRQGHPLPVREYRFHPNRKWRFDFAWPSLLLAVEVEGIVPGKGGRHQRVAGYASDCEKYAEAILLGWRVVRVVPKQIRNSWLWPILDHLIQKGQPCPEWIGDPT